MTVISTPGSPELAAGPYLGECALNINAGRRRFGQTATALSAGLLIPWANSAASNQVHDLRGQVFVNGVKATYDTAIMPGDKVVTGSDGFIVFVVADSAFMLRSRSELAIEKPTTTGFAYGLLRLVTGALGATFKQGVPVRLHAANATIGIRGTGVYLETRGNGTYFCTCWGRTELSVVGAPQEKEEIVANHHNPRLIGFKKTETGYFQSAAIETHTDAEMEILEKCVGRRAPWLKK